MGEEGGEKGCEEDVLFHIVCVSYDKISVVGEDSINLLNDKDLQTQKNTCTYLLKYTYLLRNASLFISSKDVLLNLFFNH